MPYGERVTVAGLRMIEQAEAVLKSLGFPVCRARHHQIGQDRGFLCRIEVPPADLPRLVTLSEQVVPAIRALGYTNVTIDLAGFVSGGFNSLLATTLTADPQRLSGKNDGTGERGGAEPS